MLKEIRMPKYQSNVYIPIKCMNQFLQYIISNVNHLWGYSLFLVYGLWASTMTIARIGTRVIDRNQKSSIWSRIKILLKQ